MEAQIKDPKQDYFAIKAESNSALKHFKKSPAHYRHYMDNDREETDAMRFGNLFHCMVLEPDMVKERYTWIDLSKRPEPDMNFGATKNKEWKKEIEEDAANSGKIIVSIADKEKAEAMQESMHRVPKIRELLELRGEYEKVFQWTDAETGLKCKAKADKWVDGLNIVIDPKTCEDASLPGFQRHSYNMGYHMAAAFYTDGIKCNRFFFIAIEKKPPFAPNLFEASVDFLQFGRDQYKRYLRALKECEKKNHWPAYEYWQPIGGYDIDVPAWAQYDFV